MREERRGGEGRRKERREKGEQKRTEEKKRGEGRDERSRLSYCRNCLTTCFGLGGDNPYEPPSSSSSCPPYLLLKLTVAPKGVGVVLEERMLCFGVRSPRSGSNKTEIQAVEEEGGERERGGERQRLLK